MYPIFDLIGQTPPCLFPEFNCSFTGWQSMGFISGVYNYFTGIANYFGNLVSEGINAFESFGNTIISDIEALVNQPCQPEPGKLIPIPLKCQEVYLMQEAQCPLLELAPLFPPLCDLVLLPKTNDPIGVIANLPILLLFIISSPARFLYCTIYSVSAFFGDLSEIYIIVINTVIDLLLNPLVSAVQGFIDGDNQSNYDPGSVDNRAIIPQTCLFQIPGLGEAINIIDQGMYTIGYAIGYVFSLIKILYDLILVALCTISSIPFIGGLVSFITQYINCGCVLSATGVTSEVGSGYPSETSTGYPSETSTGYPS